MAPVAQGQESSFTYTGSLAYSSGDYTLSETTTSLILWNGLGYRKGRWSLSATLPLIHQDSPYVSYVAGTPVPSGRRLGSATDGTTDGSEDQATGTGASGRGRGGTVVVPDPATLDFEQTGLGDPTVRVDVTALDRSASGLKLGVYGSLKPPVADTDNGFSTGEWDYGAGFTVAKKVSSTLVLVDLGYWVLGDLPDLELDDPWTATLGLGWNLSDGRSSILASVTGWTETVDGADGLLQASLTWSRRTPAGRALSVSVGAGLSDSAPDYTVSTGWRIGL